MEVDFEKIKTRKQTVADRKQTMNQRRKFSKEDSFLKELELKREANELADFILMQALAKLEVKTEQ